ncbi:unnamed protein product, partial [Brenthis ino]
MHKYITENGFSHACHIEIVFEEEEIEICEESEPVEVSVTDSEKASVRRRGCAVTSLQRWEWCTRRKSGRKKPDKETIYDILHKMVPLGLVPEAAQNKEQVEETSPEVANLVKLFDETVNNDETEGYFGKNSEKDDVKSFIDKHTKETKDIIDLLNDYLSILSIKYKLKWPEGLSKVYVEANNCYNNHTDIPACNDENHNNLLQYVSINLLAQEFMVNEKINLASDKEATHELNVVESINLIISQKPTIFSGSECLENILRSLWLKVHIHYLNKCNQFMLEYLYLLLEEFQAMGDHHDTYFLYITNFTFRPLIQENEILKSITSIERNIKLSIVMDLYRRGNYEEVLSIIIESFEQCKMIARKQDEKISLDFAVQLYVIIESYWALNKIDCCIKWAFVCLHESLKIYLIVQSTTKENEKWSRTITKILYCIEHILETEGLSVLDMVSEKELSQGIDDLIRLMSHQIETNLSDIPFDTISPWIILHYILQREEDQGRSRVNSDKNDAVPNSLKVLFLAHEELGEKSWCCHSEGKLLYFILDNVVPRLRAPVFAKSLEQIKRYLEQCVFCLYAYHPVKKPKMKAVDHKASGSHTLDWKRAQQVYEIFRPTEMPVLTGNVAAITIDMETLFQRILLLLPAEYDLSKYVLETEKYINCVEEKLPVVPPLLPYKMRDIYLYLGDHHFKRKDYKLAIKYNILDVVINNDRFLSWAQIALSKAAMLDNALILFNNFNEETEFLNTAKSTIRCFKRSVELNPKVSYLWVEYGMFAYRVHSFCSRLLKQASESLSMEEFETIEKQKEDFLDITNNCLTVVENLQKTCPDSDKSDNWLLYYTLGKVAEKRNKPPSVYLTFYMQGVKSLKESGATYPTKISYNTSSHLCIEVLELHYRIHASILKYIEQHENKPIPATVGKVFINCLEEWKHGPFSKKNKKYNDMDIEIETKSETQSVQAGNILKRSVSDAGEEDTHEAKRLKLEAAAAKVRRSASYDTECFSHKDSSLPTALDREDTKEDENIVGDVKTDAPTPNEQVSKTLECPQEKLQKTLSEDTEINNDKQDESSSSSSSSSSSNSNSSESSSDSSSNSSANSDNSSKSSQDSKPITEEEINKIVSACLDALEDCASRYTPHYKALYRLAHYHFYSKKGKDIEKCRDIMLSTFVSRSGQKMTGLFSDKKSKNFFNNIWRFTSTDVEKAGGFASHMNRSVLLTLEILKEIDDHKTLLDISLHLQKNPDKDKKYLRDSDREELAQQAFTLSVQSLKGQVFRFSQQEDLKSNEVERQALKSLMFDISKAYNKVQKQPNSKQLVNLLVDAYKLVMTTPVTENMNLVDLSIKYCSNISKQQETVASMDKTQNLQKKQSVKYIDTLKAVAVVPTQTKVDPKPQNTSSSVIPKISSSQELSYPDYLPILNDPLLSQQTAAALSYIGNMSALAGYASLQNSLQSTFETSFQSSYQADIYRLFLEQNFSPYSMMHQKKKRGPKPMRRSLSSGSSQTKQKPYSVSLPSVSKAAPTPVITSLQKSTSQLTPSMGTVLSSLPPSMTASLTSFGATSTHSSSHSFIPQAHSSSSSISVHSKPTILHKVSPSKTLQEKLAEKHKNLPSTKTVPQEINASISRLPSSLTITKTSSSKQPLVQGKKPEIKNDMRPKPISSDEVIVLDDD